MLLKGESLKSVSYLYTTQTTVQMDSLEWSLIARWLCKWGVVWPITGCQARHEIARDGRVTTECHLQPDQENDKRSSNHADDLQQAKICVSFQAIAKTLAVKKPLICIFCMHT